MWIRASPPTSSAVIRWEQSALHHGALWLAVEFKRRGLRVNMCAPGQSGVVSCGDGTAAATCSHLDRIQQLLTICLWLWLLRLFNRPLVAAGKCHNVTFYLMSSADVSGQNWFGCELSCQPRCAAWKLHPTRLLMHLYKAPTGMIGLGTARWQALATGGMLGKFNTLFSEDGL